jgi:hypothetical protein
MIGDLEAKKIMNGLECLGVLRCDSHPCAAVHFLEFVLNLTAQLLHDGHAGRRYVVDKHGDFEIARGKQFHDVREMFANLVLAGSVLWIIGLNFDGPAIAGQQEMMSGFFVRKAHGLVAPFHHLAMMIVGLCLIILLLRAGRECQGEQCYENYAFHDAPSF